MRPRTLDLIAQPSTWSARPAGAGPRLIRSLLHVLVLLPLTGAVAPAADPFQDLVQRETTAAACARALNWMRSCQAADGAFRREAGQATLGHTALVLLAHLAQGHRIDRGPLQRALNYVLAQQDAQGYFNASDASRMYGHGIATLLVAEAIGRTANRPQQQGLMTRLQRACALIIRAAEIDKEPGQRGGWRYTPEAHGSDLSVTVWQLAALHAARRVGVDVPEPVFSAAGSYIAGLCDHSGRAGYINAEQDHRALCGVALFGLALDSQPHRELQAALARRIVDRPLRWQGPWFFYASYADAVGLTYGSPDQHQAERRALIQLLLEHQHPEGWWPAPPGDNEHQHGRLYTASMAVLALSTDSGFLPGYLP